MPVIRVPALRIPAAKPLLHLLLLRLTASGNRVRAIVLPAAAIAVPPVLRITAAVLLLRTTAVLPTAVPLPATGKKNK